MIGFAGVGILLRPGSGFDLLGVGVIVLGQLAWALGAKLAPRAGLPMTRGSLLAWNCWPVARRCL